MPEEEIRQMRDSWIKELDPVEIYLFGSAAAGTFGEDSDLDFFLVVSDQVKDIVGEAARAYRAVREIKRHPVDILLGTVSSFNKRKEIPTLEREVFTTGRLLYRKDPLRV